MKCQLVNHRHQADAPADWGDVQSLAQLVVAQANAARGVVDAHYIMTEIVIDLVGQDTRTLVVELVDHGSCQDAGRWHALAFDETSGKTADLSMGATVRATLAGLNLGQG